MELIGRRFGHIRVTHAVGQGGMGDVYAGFDETLERKVALKVLQPDQRLDEEARERLLREARALSQLDHPNICRIHDYIESGDVDLLVLEYIDGRTLQDVMQEGLSRGEKLRIAVAVAEVLVAAHRAGIVHRDLKPENVMLTKNGEVKVLDFGLARWLKGARSPGGRRSSGRLQAVRLPIGGGNGDALRSDMTVVMPVEDDDGSSTPTGRRDLATAMGITLGTPLYMSPEQARGDTITSASDMFAFGLLLQALFTGEEPHPEGLTAREVILRVARGVTRPVSGAPGDVGTLINSLKQLAPADRPTAVETVRKLKYLADKPGRIARRALAAAVVLILMAGGWRYMVDLRRERATAVAARAQAEDLIEFMLGDLKAKLDAVGRLDVLDDVGKRALQYVEGLDPASMTADELARNAKALNQIGEVRVGQGKIPEALDLFRRSLKLAQAATTREPRNPRALMALGTTHFWMGNGLRLQGNQDDALRHMREYMKAGDALAALDPKQKDYQLERAYGHSGVAAILEMKGDLAEALRHYDVSLQVKQELARRDPKDADAQAELARAYNKVGVVLYQSGDLRAARDRFEHETAIYRELVLRDPKNTDWKHRLANSMAYLARLLYASGNSAGAFALWQEELAIERELAALDPANVSWQRSVAVTTRRLAAAMAARGETEEALPLFLDARKKMARAIALAPTRKTLLIDSAALDTDYARAAAAAGDRTGARETLRAAMKTLEETFPPTDRGARVELARSAYTLGETLSTADAAAAAQAWERAERELQPLIRANENPLDLDLWTRILIRRGRLDEAGDVLKRLKRSGYVTPELEAMCRESGC